MYSPVFKAPSAEQLGFMSKTVPQHRGERPGGPRIAIRRAFGYFLLDGLLRFLLRTACFAGVSRACSPN
jgi:hypothetical protein